MHPSRVKGEVRNPGVYGIRPGERLSSVLKRAGGLLPTAYPQGVIFTRISVRELQEKSRQELIQRIEQEGAVVKTSLTTSGLKKLALQQEATQQRERVLEALRRAPVSGRLVIRLQPGLKGFENSSQDIELRNGDTIEIPKQPGFVLVVGQVYNTNAITYTPGKNAGWYLSQGGGATRLADKSAIFIVRANGEVISRHQGGWWSGNVLSARDSSGRHHCGPGAAGYRRYPLEESHCACANRGGSGDYGCGCSMRTSPRKADPSSRPARHGVWTPIGTLEHGADFAGARRHSSGRSFSSYAGTRAGNFGFERAN